MSNGKKVIVALAAIILVVGGYYFFSKPNKIKAKPINIYNQSTPSYTNANTGPVSPISGLSCDNWSRRPVAVMQPVDFQARPVAGFSQAEMVFEMPNPAAGMFVTRFMGIYQCNMPEEIGAIRSARQDYIAVAKGLDAIFVNWGGSAFAIKKLNEGVIDNIDCNGEGGKKAPQCCFRKERTGLMRAEDNGYVKGQKILDCSKEFGYRMDNKFIGYPHQADLPEEQRIQGGNLRIGFHGVYEAKYDYDRESNSYLRTWGGKEDIDRNNNQRVAPKNIVVMIAENEQILADVNYSDRPQDPWAGLEEWEKIGPKNISGRYNNIQIGDPWFDTIDSGEAHFYFNGQEYRGSWKKDKASAESKLFFYDEAGQEIKFVPGLIWVEVLVPGQNFSWQPV